MKVSRRNTVPRRHRDTGTGIDHSGLTEVGSRRCSNRLRNAGKGGPCMTQSHVQILIVDDERNIRNNLTTVLESAGYKVDASGDGEDALTKCKERHYDIALVDIQMPKMGGLELLRYLRTLRPNL